MISDDFYKIDLYIFYRKFYNILYILHHFHSIWLLDYFFHYSFLWLKIFYLLFMRSHFSPCQQECDNYIFSALNHELYFQRVKKYTFSKKNFERLDMLNLKRMNILRGERQQK